MLQFPQTRQRFVQARVKLLLNDEAFFAPLAMRLTLVEDLTCNNAWTDGTSLGYNPQWIDTLDSAQLRALIAHEVMHCAAGHPWRRDQRDPLKWNVACDRVINPILRQAGFTLPKGALYELAPDHLGKSSEWVYDRLPPTPPSSQQQPASGSSGVGGLITATGQPGGTPAPGEAGDSFGEVRDAPSPTASQGDPAEDADAPGGVATNTEEDWRQAVAQAATMAKQQGKLPGMLDRFALSVEQSRVDWRSVMRRFVQEVTRADYTFARPNQRYAASGWILPSLHSPEVGTLAIGVDTSGSIDAVLLSQFAAEIQALVDEVQPREVRVLYADAAVQREDVFLRGDPVVMRPAGGGGTDFRPVFNRVLGDGESPVAVIYLTDLYGTFPAQEPDVPTLWVTADAEHPAVPFGEVLVAA